MFLSLPLWRKVHGDESKSNEKISKDLSFGNVLKIPGVKMMCSLFIASCAIECTCGGWGSTFLVEYKHLPAEKAAQIIMIYYIGMTVGRFLSGVLAAKLHSWKIIKLGQIVLGIALLLLILPGGVYLCAVGMFLIGLGNGPLFPNFNYLPPRTSAVMFHSRLSVFRWHRHISELWLLPHFAVCSVKYSEWLFFRTI